MVNGRVVAAILDKVRREKPLIHHLTNYVTMGDCAAITASVGAVPVMAQAKEEVEEMIMASRAAVINTGTLSPQRACAMEKMGKKAREKGIPVVFDPVGAGATSYRSGEIRKLLQEIKPPVIKGNKAEIFFLSGIEGSEIRGTQTISDGGDPLVAVRRLMAQLCYGGVVAMTGPVDVVCAWGHIARVYNGNPLLPVVVGSGCMAASVVAAFAAVEGDCFTATAAALALIGVAAELAAKTTGGDEALGPAAFKNRWLDALYLMQKEQLENSVRIEVEEW